MPLLDRIPGDQELYIGGWVSFSELYHAHTSLH